MKYTEKPDWICPNCKVKTPVPSDALNEIVKKYTEIVNRPNGENYEFVSWNKVRQHIEEKPDCGVEVSVSDAVNRHECGVCYNCQQKRPQPDNQKLLQDIWKTIRTMNSHPYLSHDERLVFEKVSIELRKLNDHYRTGLHIIRI